MIGRPSRGKTGDLGLESPCDGGDERVGLLFTIDAAAGRWRFELARTILGDEHGCL